MITAKYILDNAVESNAILDQSNESVIVTYDDLRLNKPPMNYITLDGLGVDLYDDTSEFISENDYCGYISKNVSDAEGYISNRISIYGLTDPDSPSPEDNLEITHGIFLGFEQDFATNVIISAYNSEDTLLFQKEVEITQLNQHIELESFVCNHIYIDFTRTQQPNSFIKLNALVLGSLHKFEDFASFYMIDEINLLSDDLPIGQIEFSVFSNQDLLGQKGNTVYFYDGSDLMGEYYLLEVERETKTKYNFVVQNLLYKADNTSYVGYARQEYVNVLESEIPIWQYPFNFVRPTNYQVDQNYTELGALEAALSSADIPYEIDATLLTNNNLWLPPFLQKGSCRYALAQLCWALGAFVVCSDKVYIKPFSSIASGTLKTIRNEDSRILKTSVKKSAPVSNAIWETTDYIAQEEPTVGNVKEVAVIEVTQAQLDSNYSIWGVTIDFDVPTKATGIVGGTVMTGSVTESPYQLNFAVKTAGTYTVWGFELSKSTSTEQVLVNSQGAEKKYSRYDLILLDGNKKPLLTPKKDNILAFCKNDKTLTATIGYDGEKVGDYISIQTNLDDMFTGIITRIEFSSPRTYRTAEIEVQQWDM